MTKFRTCASQPDMLLHSSTYAFTNRLVLVLQMTSTGTARPTTERIKTDGASTPKLYVGRVYCLTRGSCVTLSLSFRRFTPGLLFQRGLSEQPRA